MLYMQCALPIEATSERERGYPSNIIKVTFRSLHTAILTSARRPITNPLIVGVFGGHTCRVHSLERTHTKGEENCRYPGHIWLLGDLATANHDSVRRMQTH
jgi:hypothetical protein